MRDIKLLTLKLLIKVVHFVFQARAIKQSKVKLWIVVVREEHKIPEKLVSIFCYLFSFVLE